MFKIKSLLFFGILITTSSHYGQYTDIINSNRPGKSISAFSVGKTVIQAEAGIFAKDEDHSLLNYSAPGFGSELSLRYGAFFEQFELSLDMQYQQDYFTGPLVDETRSGLKQTTLGAKYLIYDPFLRNNDKPNLYSWKANHKFKWKEFIPAVAVYGGLNVRLGNNPFTFQDDLAVSPKFILVTQNHFSNKWVFVTNIIADKVLTKFPSYGYVATLTRGFNMRWSGFLESQGYMSDFYADNIFRVGAAYLIRENIQLDASVSKNFKDTPDLLLGGIGVSWRFDANYEDFMLRSPKEKSKKSKDKKSKKDTKKRKDEVDLENTKP